MEAFIGFSVIVISLLLLILPIVTLSILVSLKRRMDGYSGIIRGVLKSLDALKLEIESLIRPAPQTQAAEPVIPEEQFTPAPPLAEKSAPAPAAPPPVPPPIPPSAEDGAAGEPAPKTARPAPWIEAAHEILRKIWSWILVGEEYRRPGVSMEFAVATTWLMRVGIVAVVFFVGYFLKWSIERELIGPRGRVAVSICFGLALLAAGIKMLNRRWHILGQGFVGGGLATLYFSMFAAGPLYELLPIPAAFALMALVTLAAGLLAVRARSMLVAIFGIIGGFCTPILLKSDQPQLPVFYGYLLLLNLGILGIAHYRQWRLLNYLGFVFTYALFFLSLSGYRRGDFNAALVFTSAVFAVHSLLVMLYNIRRAIRATLLEVIHMVLNAGLFFAGAYWLIEDAFGRPCPALLTLALAVFYILQTAWFLRRRLEDRPLLTAMIALAGFFSALTLPLVMEKESLTISFSLLALMFVWLGLRMNSNFLRQLGYLLYGVVFFRFLFLDLPRNYHGPLSAATPWLEYARILSARLWNFGTAIASAAAAFLLERRAAARAAGPRVVSAANDVRDPVPSSAAAPVLCWTAILALFVFLQLEFHAMLVYYTLLRPGVSMLLLCGLGAYVLARFIDSRHTVAWGFLCILLAAAAVKIFFFDFYAWQFKEFYFAGAYTFASLAARWLDFAALLGLLFMGWSLLGRRQRGPQVFGYGGLALLFIFTSFEVNSLLFWKLENFRAGGISVLWSLFAAAFIAGGIWKQVRPLRYIGLILFAVVAYKVFFMDLKQMLVIYKALAALGVGALLLVGSFAYLYAGRQFQKHEGDGQ